jgi:hypothetical protein
MRMRIITAMVVVPIQASVTERTNAMMGIITAMEAVPIQAPVTEGTVTTGMSATTIIAKVTRMVRVMTTAITSPSVTFLPEIQAMLTPLL